MNQLPHEGRTNPSTRASSQRLVKLVGVEKRFGGVQALDQAQFELNAGEIHGLLGENGAGKTTLARIIGGLTQPDRGSLEVRGQHVDIPNAAAGRSLGISMVHQHFSLVPRFTGYDNVRLFAASAWASPHQEARTFRQDLEARASDLGLDVALDVPVERLGVGDKQRIEILKALVDDPDILLLDEPTAVLTPQEVTGLFAVLRRLAESGTGIVLVAHKLDEVLSIADRVTVLRNGSWVFTKQANDLTPRRLAHAMVTGNPDPQDSDLNVETALARTSSDNRNETILSAEDLSAPPFDTGPGLQGASLSVKRGELVGIAGVEGNGQKELAFVLAGLLPPSGGRVTTSPSRVGYIPQDRNLDGLIPEFTLTQNVALALHNDPDFANGPLLLWDKVEAVTKQVIDELDVKALGPSVTARTLSGGNQQKILTGRELLRSGDLLIAENPTRGLDIAAAAEVRSRILTLVNQPNPPGVVLFSTDLDEILEMADRILVLVRGRLIPVGEKDRSTSTIGSIMLGGMA